LLVEAWENSPVNTDDTILIAFKIRNFGLTPAWIVNLRSKAIVLQNGTSISPEPDFGTKSPNWDADASGLVIPPKESIPRTRIIEGSVLSGDQCRALMRGAGFIFVFGTIEFEDFMGERDTIAFSAMMRTRGTDPKTSEHKGWYWIPNVRGPTYHHHGRKSGHESVGLSKDIRQG
jgi:hypothetical protein